MSMGLLGLPVAPTTAILAPKGVPRQASGRGAGAPPPYRACGETVSCRPSRVHGTPRGATSRRGGRPGLRSLERRLDPLPTTVGQDAVDGGRDLIPVDTLDGEEESDTDPTRLTPHAWKEHFLPEVEQRRDAAQRRLFKRIQR